MIINKCTVYAHNYEETTGWDDELVKYLNNGKVRDVVKISFPFMVSSRGEINVNKYKYGRLHVRHFSEFKFYKPEFISYFKDFIYGIFYGLKYARGSDLFVGMDNLLAINGIILRKIGLVKVVCYCMIDYTPRRYNNAFLNSIYYKLDRFACHNSDVVWPLTKEMITGRHRDGRIDLKKVNYFVTPFGNNSESYKNKDFKEFNRFKIVYFGGMVKSKGLDLFLPIMEKVVARGYENTEFIFIGPGDIDKFKTDIKNHGLENNCKVYGSIKDHKKIEKMLLSYGIAIAPYLPVDKNSFSYYADPGKIKVYLGCGLPIITTKVPPIASILKKRNAGLIAKYDADDFALKIISLLSDEKKYSFIKSSAVELGKEYSWPFIFNRALSDLGFYERKK